MLLSRSGKANQGRGQMLTLRKHQSPTLADVRLHEVPSSAVVCSSLCIPCDGYLDSQIWGGFGGVKGWLLKGPRYDVPGTRFVPD